MSVAAAAAGAPSPCPIDPWLLERLVCPITRTPLAWDGARGMLVSHSAGLAYPLREGVPVLLLEAAVAV